MKQYTDNNLEGSNIGEYTGGNTTKNYYNVSQTQDTQRKFVVTHNANIKPVSYFTGRETELQELRQRIEEGRKSVLVSGMGGIGKTQICRKLFEEYYIRHGKGENGPFLHIGYIEYSGDMDSSLMKCLRYKEQDNPELNKEAAWRELEDLASEGKLLLFVDNVDKPVGADAGLKRLNAIPGAVVLTSRRTSLGKEFGLLKIGFLSTEQCKKIYERIRYEDSDRKVPEEDVLDLEYIIDTLAAGHTITIEFLANLAKNKHWNVKRLRDELKSKKFRLEYRDEEDKLINIQECYETLYDLSSLNKAEQNILEAFSLFPYIPLAVETCNKWLLVDAGAGENDDVLMGLYQKGWLQFDVAQESYALHPVFAQFIYEKYKPKAEKHRGLMESCQNNLKIPKSGSVFACQQYIPFAENIVGKIDIGTFLKSVELEFQLVAIYIAEYKKAEKILKNFQDVENNNLDAAVIHNNLAMVYVEQGEYEKAEKLLEKSLQIWNSELGENHPDTAIGYNNLALLYEKQGEYGKAKELFRKSLFIQENVLGKTHLDTANSYNNLAQVYASCGEYEKSTELQDKSLFIWKSVLGENHPITAKGYNNLALLYEEQGEYGKAEELLKKVCILGKVC